MSNVTLGGDAVELSGNFPQPGETIQSFTLTNNSLEDVKLSSWDGKRKILSIFPSIDTGVCAASTRKFNEKAADLGQHRGVGNFRRPAPLPLPVSVAPKA